MSERDGYIEGVPCWVDTTHPDPEAAAAFYSGLFGWECEDVMPPDAPGHYFMARIRGGDVAGIGSPPPGAPATPAWNTYIWVESADAAVDKVWEAGGTCVAEPFDVGDAGRMATFTDLEGAAFSVWQPNRHRGARVVNEHGALNFNTLTTRDPSRAREFYGAVFGWQTLHIGPGGEMWTLPGYGDHLERDRPALREEMAAVGAPPGFEDVVASLVQPRPEEPDVAPHWSVTFSVDDADVIAAAAAALGGRVLIAPFDAPWVRSTVIADPQGATFIASQFVLENRPQGAAQAPAAA